MCLNYDNNYYNLIFIEDFCVWNMREETHITHLSILAERFPLYFFEGNILFSLL